MDDKRVNNLQDEFAYHKFVRIVLHLHCRELSLLDLGVYTYLPSIT